MSFRAKLVLAFAASALLPLVVLAFGMRREMSRRLSRQSWSRAASVSSTVTAKLASMRESTRERLHEVSGVLAADNRFRLAEVAHDSGAARSLIDWAAGAMPSAGFAALQVQDSSGRIVSSGHYRNQFGQVDAVLPAFLDRAGAEGAIIDVVTTSGDVRVLAMIDSFRVASRRYVVIGGTRFTPGDIAAGDPEVAVNFEIGSAHPGSHPDQLAREALPYLRSGDTASSDSAIITVTRRPDPMLALQRSVDRWSLAALGIVAFISIVLAGWLGTRISRPLSALAAQTETIDLDRLDQDFGGGGDDEIGALSRLLQSMVDRLRASTVRVREVERRLATGDLARQVNHDVKNGLAPIRHVIRHLGQVAEQHPEQLVTIYQERRGTLEKSVEYLETLARQYAKLSPVTDPGMFDLNRVVAEVGTLLSTEGAALETHCVSSPLVVRADALVLRRIVENLARNAVEASQPDKPAVRLVTSLQSRDGHAHARVEIIDQGTGMSQEDLDRAFRDFFTTKPDGTGLGLSVVQRLVADLGGTLRVETEPGRGSRFSFDLPLVPGQTDLSRGANA